MAEDLSANLQSYQMQLQQVEAALTNEPNSEELLKLKSDLQEVIHLTTELISASSSEKTSTDPAGTSKPGPSVPSFKAGDGCMAPWSEDGQYYEAVIDEISETGQCNVTFLAYGNTDITDLVLLRPLENASEFPEKLAKSKKQLLIAQKDYKKKKAQKKAQRMKALEEEREKEKSKWHNFNTKALNKKGYIKKSIFATPENVNGRVGIGTCGIGGRPMTEFQQQEKWRKGTQAQGALSKFRGHSSHMQ